MTTETHAQLIARLRARGIKLGFGKAAHAARVAKVIARQRPPKPRAFHPDAVEYGKPIRCLDTGQIFPSLKACVAAMGGNQPALSKAFREATGDPRVAEWKGRRFVFVGEEKP